jgi:hypothetical protein
MRRRQAFTVLFFACLVTAGPAHAGSLRPGDIAVTADSSIIKIDPLTGEQAVVASGGLLSGLSGITVTPWRDVFVIQALDTIVRIARDTGHQSVVSQGGLLLGSADITWLDGQLFLPSLFRPCGVPGFLTRSVIRVDPRNGEQAVAFDVDCASGQIKGDEGFFLNPIEIEGAPDEATVVLLDRDLSGSFGGVALIDAEDRSVDFHAGLFEPREIAVAPDGDILIRTHNLANLDEIRIEIWDPTFTIRKGVLPAERSYTVFDVTATGEFIGVAPSGNGTAEVYRVDLASGAETLLASLRGDVTDLTVVPEICPCNAAWKDHGQYVSCVASEVDRFVTEGFIATAQRGGLVSFAARESCGRKN